jgi:hypothetical protein
LKIGVEIARLFAFVVSTAAKVNKQNKKIGY